MVTTGSPRLPLLAILNSIIICCHLRVLRWLAWCWYSILHSWRDWALESMTESFSELPHIAAHLMGQEAAGDAKVYQRATSVSLPTLARKQQTHSPCCSGPIAITPPGCWFPFPAGCQQGCLMYIGRRRSLDLSSSSVQWKVMLFGIWSSSAEKPEFYT